MRAKAAGARCETAIRRDKLGEGARGEQHMDLRSIFVTNGVGVFILLMLLYVSRTRTLRRRMEDRLFSAMVIGVMAGCILEAFSYAIDGQTFAGARILNYIANTYLYTANLLLPLCVLAYFDLGLYGDRRRLWECYKPQIIIAAVMITITLVNLFVPLVFWISEGNVYERRPLSYVYFVVILYYCISALVVARRFERDNGASAFFHVELFLFPIMLGVILQFMFYGLSLAWMASALGLTGLFMMQQNEMAYIDSLTDVYNRRYLNDMLTAWISKGETFAGVMLDIDRFKAINDTYGHSEGDRVLKDVAEMLTRSRMGGEWVFRFAGDEFIVLKRADSEDEIKPYLENVNRNVERFNLGDRPYELAVSYGASFFESGDIDTFMKTMDDKMYEMKEAHHNSWHG